MTDGSGMVPAAEWEQTAVHQHSRYSCGKCGEGFASPQAVYEHMDAEHPTEKPKRSRRKRERA